VAKVVDWKSASVQGVERLIARFVLLSDGTYREVHFLPNAGVSMQKLACRIEGSGISAAEASEEFDNYSRLYTSRGFWATAPYEMPDDEAIRGDVRDAAP
jgi:hypothetical protein